jgi:nucleotide-binding universal stress UspA family protein
MKTSTDYPAVPFALDQPSNLPTQSFFEDPLKIRTMLVPVDFSEESFRALDYAWSLAKRFGASVQVVYVYDGESQISSMATAPVLFSDAEIAGRLSKEVQRRFGVDLRRQDCHVRSGRPFREIAASARELKTDLVVIATCRAGFTDLLLGSTAEKVIRHAHCPVLVVRESTGGPFKTKTEGIVLQKILVPVDFSECAREGAKYASVFATRVGANLLLMHVIQPPDYTAQKQSSGEVERSPLVAAARLEAEDKLEELVNFLPLVGISAEIEVGVGLPVERLAEETKRPDVDMVITSTHGYTGLRHALIGSTAEQLVRRAHCPVLVVPSHCRQLPH